MTSDRDRGLRLPVNHSSPIPYYVQVKDALIEWIIQARWKAGDQLPGENELCLIFDVSRPVIRQALNELALQGVVYREKGKGTFVTGPKIKEGLVQRLTGFYQDMAAQGFTPQTKVLAQEKIQSNPDIASCLQLDLESPVIKIERLRAIEGEPIVLVTTFIPFDLCPQLLHEDLSDQSLYTFLEQSCGVSIVYGRRTLEAVPASKYAAALLKVRKGSPLILLNSVSYDKDGRPVEYYFAYHRGDRSQFEVELVRGQEGQIIRDTMSERGVFPPTMLKSPRS